MSPGLPADLSARVGTVVALLLIGIGLVGSGMVVGALLVIRRWEQRKR